MERATLLKFGQFLLIVTLGIAADQWTKHYAEARLASSRLKHHVALTVPQGAQETTVTELLTQEFTWSTPEQIEKIARFWTLDAQQHPAMPDTKLAAGESITITQRSVVIVPGYFDFEYTRNPGAAFSFLADTNSPYKLPFFIITTIIALGVILYIMRGVSPKQQVLIWGLSLIAGGAAGNFIDRIRFNYVIDFILWKYTDAYRWPTFNIADALICIGVGLMLIEIVRDTLNERKLAKEGQPAQDLANPIDDAEPDHA